MGDLIHLALEVDIHYNNKMVEIGSKGKSGETTITIMQGFRRSRKELS